MSRRSAKRKTDSVVDYSKDVASADPEQVSSAKRAHMSSSNRQKRLSAFEDHGSTANGRGKSDKISDKFSFFDRHREKKTSDAIIAEFEAQIGRQTSSMRKVIVNEEKKIEQKRVEFKTTFEELFAACAPGITKGIQKQQHTNDRNSRAEHILFEEAESVKRGSQELLAKFERMDEMLKSQDLKLPLQAWTQDRHDYTEIMMCGREHGQQVAEGILAPGLYDEPPTRSRDLTENQEIAAGLLKESKKALVEDSWGTVFDDQLRCGVALANTISAEVLKPKGTRLS